MSPETGARIGSRFILGAVNIDGATKFTPAELAQSFEPYLASEVGQAELDRIVRDITDRYRAAGYVLSYARLPQQAIQSGVVRVEVVEAYIDEVQVEGPSRAAALVRRMARGIAQERPLTESSLERMLGNVRDLPGVVVSETRIRRSPGDPTRHQLTIVLGSKRASLFAYSDNRGTINGARLRGFTSITLASLLTPGDQLQFDVFAIPSDDFRYVYGMARFALPVGHDGLRLAGSLSTGDQHQRFAGPDQDGKSRQLLASLSYPWVKTRALSITGHASFADWKSEERKGGDLFQRDRLQVIRLAVDAARLEGSKIDARVTFSRGVDFGPVTRRGDPLASRPGADSTFTKVSSDIQFVDGLSEAVTLRMDAAAQYSWESLLAPEEFALGGSRVGRAFDFNEITGDSGAGAMVELAFRPPHGKLGRDGLELFTFIDGGFTHRRRSSPELPRDQWLAGTGIGARAPLFGVLWSGEIGVPLARSGTDRDVRAFFSASRIF